MKNDALDFIRSDRFKKSKGKIFAWPMLIVFLIFDWEFK